MVNSSKFLYSNVWHHAQGREIDVYPTARMYGSTSTRTEQEELGGKGGANIYSSTMWPREQADAPARSIHHRKVQTRPQLVGSQKLFQKGETGKMVRGL